MFLMLRDLISRLRSARLWLLLQLLGLPLLLLLAIGWSRIGEKYLWQVALSLLLPLVIIAALLALQAGTMRRLLAPLAEHRASFLLATLVLFVWLVVAFLAWHLLDSFDDHVWSWAAWINSKAPAGPRGQLLNYSNLQLWLTRIEWFLRWVVIPSIFVPLAMSSAEHGWRLPWRAVLHAMHDWRWLPAVFLLALLGVALPGKFFTYNPHGTLHAQIWTVSAKLIAAYLLALLSWLLLLAWSAVLLRRKESATSQLVVTVQEEPSA